MTAEGLLRERAPGAGGAPERGAAGSPRRWTGRAWLAALAVAVVSSLVAAGVGRHAVTNPQGLVQLREFAEGALRPALSPDLLVRTASATFVTLAFAALGTVLAVLLGVVGGLLVSRSWWHGLLAALPGWVGVRAVLALPRGLHEAVWGLVLVNVYGPDPWVGVLALGLPYGAVTAKVYADLLDEAPRAPHTALVAAGAGRLRAFAYGLLPQTFPDMLSYAFYRFDCAIRSAVVLGIIGVGGLGFQLEAAFQALAYDRMWTAVYALVVVCGVADLVSHRLRRRLGAPRAFTCWRQEPGGPSPAPSRDRVLATGAVLGLALAVWAWWYLGLHPARLGAPEAGRQVAYVAGQAWPPATDVATLAALGRASVETLQMSVLATALATGTAILVAPLAARPGAGSSRARRAAAATCRAGLLLARAVPAPVWAFVVLFVLLPGPLPGAVALAVYNLGVLGRLMGESVENLEPRPTRVLTAQGAPAVAAFAYGVLPRAVPRFLAYGLYRWEVAVRETVVVGLVGAGGLGFLLARQVAAFDWNAVLATLLALVLLTVVVDLVSAAARRAVR